MLSSAGTTKLVINRPVVKHRAPSWEAHDTSFLSSEYKEVKRVVANAYKTQTPGHPRTPVETIAPSGDYDSFTGFDKLGVERPARHQVYNTSMKHLPDPTRPLSLHNSHTHVSSCTAEIAPGWPQKHRKVMNMPSANKSDGALHLLQPTPSMELFASEMPYGPQRTFHGFGQAMAKHCAVGAYSPQSEKSSPSPTTPMQTYRDPPASTPHTLRRRVTPLRQYPVPKSLSVHTAQRERRVPSPLPEYDPLFDAEEGSPVSSYAPTFPTAWSSNRSSNTTITEHDIFPSFKPSVELPDVDRSPLFTDEEQESVTRYLSRMSVDSKPFSVESQRTSEYSSDNRSQRTVMDDESARHSDQNSMVLLQQPTNTHMRTRLTSGATPVPSILGSLGPNYTTDGATDLDETRSSDYSGSVKRNNSWAAQRVQKDVLNRTTSGQRKQRGTDRSMPPVSRGMMLLQSQSTTDLDVVADDGVYRAIMPDIPRSMSLRLGSTTSLATLEKNIRYRQRAESKASQAAAAYAAAATKVKEDHMEEEDTLYHQFAESKVSLTMSVNTTRLEDGNNRYHQYAESKISLAMSVNTTTATRFDGTNMDEQERYRQYAESKVSLGMPGSPPGCIEEGYQRQLVKFPSMQTEDDEDDNQPRPTQPPIGMRWENPSVRTLSTPFLYRPPRSASHGTAKTLVTPTATESTIHDNDPESPSAQNEAGLKSFMDFSNDDADSDTLDERTANQGKLRKFWKKAKDGFMGKLRKKNVVGKKF